MKIICFPGLGFDHRIFKEIRVEGHSLVFQNWLEPEPKESLADYAHRMWEQIGGKTPEIGLLGHSFGGILALEMAAIQPVQTVCLISSIRSAAENPRHFKILTPLGLQHLFTRRLVNVSIRWWGKSHGYSTPEDRKLVCDMVANYSNGYLKWALAALSRWKGNKLPGEPSILQIHGNQDKTFPIGKIQRPDHVIPGGNHYMIVKKAPEISRILSQHFDHISGNPVI